MNIEIKGKEIEIKFGMGFVRELDKKFDKRLGDAISERLDFGASVSVGVPMLIAGDPKILADFLYYGTNWMSSGRPTMKDIDNFIDEVDDIDAVYDEVVEALKNANACKRQAVAAVEEVESQLKETSMSES